MSLMAFSYCPGKQRVPTLIYQVRHKGQTLGWWLSKVHGVLLRFGLEKRWESRYEGDGCGRGLLGMRDNSYVHGCTVRSDDESLLMQRTLLLLEIRGNFLGSAFGANVRHRFRTFRQWLVTFVSCHMKNVSSLPEKNNNNKLFLKLSNHSLIYILGVVEIVMTEHVSTKTPFTSKPYIWTFDTL